MTPDTQAIVDAVNAIDIPSIVNAVNSLRDCVGGLLIALILAVSWKG